MSKLNKVEIEPVVVDLWPEAGRALNLGKSRTYESARAGEIPTVKFGKSLKVPMWFLRQIRDGKPE
jgi:hypothetical protein